MVTEAPKMWLFSGTVTAVNEKGMKLDSYGDDWLDFTREEWRGSWYEAAKGEHVTIQCTKGKDGKFWIKTIVLDGHQNFDEPELPPTGAPATNRDLSIVRQVCLKAAAKIIAARAHEYKDNENGPATSIISIDVLALAQDFERWAARGE